MFLVKLIDKFFSPLEHFEVNYFTYLYYYYFDFSVTTATLYFFLMNLFFILFYLVFWFYKVVPSRFQLIFENIFNLLLEIFRQQISSLRSLKIFPFYFSIIILIFLLNFTSFIAFNVSLTGHIIVTLSYSLIIFLGLIIIGFLNYRLFFLTLFFPKDVPKLLLGFLIVIELLSFLIRPFSLSIRLFANMLAGHTLLGIFAAFANFVSKNFSFFLIFPLIACFLILMLEFGVSIIQAYVFYILISIYLSDVSKLH